jgi:hypothetical protein
VIGQIPNVAVVGISAAPSMSLPFIAVATIEVETLPGIFFIPQQIVHDYMPDYDWL